VWTSTTADRRRCCSTSDCRRTELEVWLCYPAAKRFALAAGARTYHIQAVRSDVQMSQRLSTAVSVWTTPASRWPWVKAEAAIVINFSTGCAVHATIHDRRPRPYCRRAARMEQSAWLTAPTVIIETIQETYENSFILNLICATGQLVIVKRSWSGLCCLQRYSKWSTLHYITLHYITLLDCWCGIPLSQLFFVVL